MKITKQYLKKIIKEELGKVVEPQEDVIENLKKAFENEETAEEAVVDLRNKTIELNKTLKQEFLSKTKKYHSGSIPLLRQLFNDTYKGIVHIDDKDKIVPTDGMNTLYYDISAKGPEYRSLKELMELYRNAEIPRIKELFNAALKHAKTLPPQ
jgi:L-cysteine desulfidase